MPGFSTTLHFQGLACALKQQQWKENTCCSPQSPLPRRFPALGWWRRRGLRSSSCGVFSPHAWSQGLRATVAPAAWNRVAVP